jgi:hypothetical protein
MSQSDESPISLDHWEACTQCGHGAAWHDHPARAFWSQGALRRHTGRVHSYCSKEGCNCTFYGMRLLSPAELYRMVARIKQGWRGRGAL